MPQSKNQLTCDFWYPSICMRCALLLLPVLVFAQQKPVPPKATAPTVVATPAQVQALQKELDDLKKEVAALRAEVKKQADGFEGRDFLAQLYQKKVDAVIKESVTLDPAENGYGIITIDSGTFFISLEKIEPFLNGYKATLKVGNPYAITFTNVKLNVEWNKKFPKDLANYGEWVKTKHAQEFSDTTVLPPGKWTLFPVVLSDTKPDEVAYLEVKLSVQALRMGQ